jgi:hypothetical protein
MDPLEDEPGLLAMSFYQSGYNISCEYHSVLPTSVRKEMARKLQIRSEIFNMVTMKTV